MTPEERNDFSFSSEDQPLKNDSSVSEGNLTDTAQSQTPDNSVTDKAEESMDGGERSVFEDRFAPPVKESPDETKSRREQELQEKRERLNQIEAEKQARQQKAEEEKRQRRQQAEDDKRQRQQQIEEEKRQRQQQAAEEKRLRMDEAARIRAEEREERRQRRSLRRMGTLTLGLTCIALGCSILWWMTHPGTQLNYLQWFGPVVIILLGVEILLCHLFGPKKFRFDFGSLFISFCALSIALVMSFIPMTLWYFGPQRYEALADFEAAETQRIQSLLKDCSQITSIYVNSSLSYDQFYDPLSPPDNTPDFVSVHIELAPGYTTSEDFAQSTSEILTALTSQGEALPNQVNILSDSKHYYFGLHLGKDYMGNLSPESLLPLVEYRVSDEIMGETISIADGFGSIVYPPVFSMDLYRYPEELWDDIINYYEATYGVTVEPAVPDDISEDEVAAVVETPPDEPFSSTDEQETATQQLPDPSLAASE